MIKRKIDGQIQDYNDSLDNKILFIWGPRRSGKTTLFKKFADQLHESTFNFDFISDQELFSADRSKLERIVAEHKIILIDEFNVKIIATGSREL